MKVQRRPTFPQKVVALSQLAWSFVYFLHIARHKTEAGDVDELLPNRVETLLNQIGHTLCQATTYKGGTKTFWGSFSILLLLIYAEPFRGRAQKSQGEQ